MRKNSKTPLTSQLKTAPRGATLLRRSFELNCEPGHFTLTANDAELGAVFPVRDSCGGVAYDCLGRANISEDRNGSLWALATVKAYLQRINARPHTLKSACVSEGMGKYRKTVATIRFEVGTDKPFAVSTKAVQYAPTDAEQTAMAQEVIGLKLPMQTPPVRNFVPAFLYEAESKNLLFRYKDLNGDLIAFEERQATDNGKIYLWWTFYSDGYWRNLEPEDGLPLYGLEKLREASSTVILCEGAKAARALRQDAGVSELLRKLTIDHPWYGDMHAFTFLGWAGGAPNPHRTDFGPLRMARGVQRVIIVADNDDVGRQAVPEIARQLRVPTYTIQFTNEFPDGFDLGDDFPAHMFATVETVIGDGPNDQKKVHQYIGPTFRSCLQPATWLTDAIPNPDGGRPSHKLRPSARKLWVYVEDIEKFACYDDPELRYKPEALGNLLSPFAHINPLGLIRKNYNIQVKGLCYRPDCINPNGSPMKLVTAWDERQKLNVFRDGPVIPVKGDPTPWLKLLDRMFPVEEERYFMARICATLAAKLGVSMHIAVLLVSQLQGTGKSTLMKILKHLVGAHNTSEPTASEIVEKEWTDWLVYKRLICVHEIYEGRSWKAYQRLKSHITEETVRALIRYESGYEVENFATFFLGSNSMGALKIEDQDRRIFAPTVTEAPWDKTEAREFYAWLAAGGFRIIKQWALDFGNGKGEYLPSHCEVLMTDNKKEMIDASRPEIMLYADMIMMSMQSAKAPVNWTLQAENWPTETIKKGEAKPVAIALADAFDRAKEQHRDDHTSKIEFRKELTKGPHGLVYLEEQMKVNGRLTRVLLNDTARRAIELHRNCFYSVEFKAFRSKEGNGGPLPITTFSNYIRVITEKAHNIQEWK